MPLLYSQQLAGQASRPIIKPNDAAYGQTVKRFRSTINLAAVATTAFGTTQTGAAITDWIQLATIPAGYVFDYGMITASATLGATAQVAIGTNPVHASNGQYRASATFTTANTPTLFALAAAKAEPALAVDTPVYLTVSTAALPNAGTVVIDLYFTKP